MVYIVYRIVNILTEHSYIGCSKNIKRRFKHHRTSLNTNNHCNNHLQNSFNKYGKEFFKYEILYKFDNEEDMYEKEKELIDNTENIYNIAGGGLGGNFMKNWSNEKKLKYSKEKSVFWKNYFKINGTKRTNPFLNKTEKERAEMLKTWSECKKGLKNANAKYPQKIAQLKNGDIVKIWNNVYEASETGGFRTLYVLKCAKGVPGFKSHKGYQWKFID